MVSGNKLVNL